MCAEESAGTQDLDDGEILRASEFQVLSVVTRDLKKKWLKNKSATEAWNVKSSDVVLVRGMAKSRPGAEENIVSTVGEDPRDDGGIVPRLRKKFRDVVGWWYESMLYKGHGEWGMWAGRGQTAALWGTGFTEVWPGSRWGGGKQPLRKTSCVGHSFKRAGDFYILIALWW